MPQSIRFPDLNGWEPTKETLHIYAQMVSVVPRALLEPHPKWWHTSLTVQPFGLATKKIPLNDRDQFWLEMDLQQHEIRLMSEDGEGSVFDMRAGLTATQLGDRLLAAVSELGLTAEYVRERFESDEPRHYDPEMAGRFLTALTSAEAVFARHRATLGGEEGPIQLWPHGFDLAFEWFGTRVVEYEEQGEIEEYPSQLNLGFSPGESNHPAPYFYSNPWPFEADVLLDQPLPSGAHWFNDSWQGSILPYAELVDADDAGERLFAYAQAVYQIAAPTLMSA